MQALKGCKEIPDFMPSEILEKNDLCSLDYAIRNIHFPESFESLDRARKRLIFDELFILQLGLLSIKERTGEEKPRWLSKMTVLKSFITVCRFLRQERKKERSLRHCPI